MLFKKDGHLTKKAITFLCNGETSELPRLEIAEHLGFCDECLDMYMQKLSTAELLSPETPLVMPVQKAIMQQNQTVKTKILQHRTSVAAVLFLSVGIWAGASFLMPTQIMAADKYHNAPPPLSFNQRVNAAFDSAGDAIEDWIDSFKDIEINWDFLKGNDKKQTNKTNYYL